MEVSRMFHRIEREASYETADFEAVRYREIALRSSEVTRSCCSNDCRGFTVFEFVYGVYI